MEDSLEKVYDTIIIRFSGEIWLKKLWTRKYYEKRLAKNIKKILKHYNISYSKLDRKHGRFYLKTGSIIEATDKLRRVFGISSISPAVETTYEIDSIMKNSLKLAEITLKNGNRFAVRCKRVGKHNYSSSDIQKQLGKKILDYFDQKLELKVDLEKPDIILGIEIRDDQSFIYLERIQAVGGMPLGVQPSLIGLFSGGIDSVVGLWLVMKRGCPVVPIYFDNSPFTDKTTTERALKVAEKLFKWSIGFSRKIYIVQHGQNLNQIMKTNRKYSCLLCKRMMYRVAEQIAKKFHAEGIVTGEAIGEQASQTLTNLRVLNTAVKNYPVHRPLLGFDKKETEKISRNIGTFEASSKKAASCTAAPYQPSTKAKLEDVHQAEKKLDIESMVRNTLESIKIIEI
ncbi:MAG: tRNA 4-thiouridine(8) synthase ThiI [Candidatus Bathyarchaeota archaeon]